MGGFEVIANEASKRASPYVAQTQRYAIELWLDANEGPEPPMEVLRCVERAATLRGYPTTTELRDRLATRIGVSVDRVAVTAGGDDAIDRACRSVLGPGKEIILTPPTFEMFHRYAALTGAKAVNVPWDSPGFPTEQVLAAMTPDTAAIAMVSPNNPTGLVATIDDVRRVSAAAPRALVLLDLAYTEFADVDLQPLVLDLPNVVSIRTLSKAWGLAGLRVGYAVGHPDVIRWIRAAGGPYAVSGPSAAIAAAMLDAHEHVMREYVARVRVERAELFKVLEEVGLDPWPSQANFVTIGARWNVEMSPEESLARRGISVRAWSGRRDLAHNATRITCPGNTAAFDRLCRALRESAAEGMA